MTETIKSAKTVDEAVQAALDELGVSKENTEIEILEEGNKGLFGIGGKDAKVRVTVTEKLPEEYAKDFLAGILEGIGMDATLEISTDDNGMNVDISGEDMGILIGRRGETLSALQYLTSLVVNRQTEDYVRVSVDTENYKKKREETLIRLANKTAERVLKYRRNVTLEPMNPYERRIVHAALQDKTGVTTYSTGDDPLRRVVIAYKKSY